MSGRQLGQAPAVEDLSVRSYYIAPSADPAVAAPTTDPNANPNTNTSSDLKASRVADATRIPSGPNVTCRSLASINPSLYRCGDFCIWLKAGESFPDDLKSVFWRKAAAELNSRGLIEKYLDVSAKDITLSTTPNDTKFNEQAYVNGTAGYDIGAQDAWGVVTGNANVIVAVIDSGIDASHPDLEANIFHNSGETPGNGTDDDGNGLVDDATGFDFDANTADVTDTIGHGTNLAGVIGAVGNNGVGIAGINWNVKLLPLKITDGAGKASLAAAVEAINYAIANHAKVINASWVMSLSTPDKINLLQTAVQNAVSAGIVFVAAAGNNGGQDIDATPLFPASFDIPGVITVGAVDTDRALASFSNVGAGSVDLAAPGAGILSTAPGGGFVSSAGTSIATSVVSGAAALLFSQKPSLSPAEARTVLMDSATPSASLSGKTVSGGTLNLKGALAALGASFGSSGSSGSSASSTTDKSDSTVVASAPAAAKSTSGSSGGGCSLILP